MHNLSTTTTTSTTFLLSPCSASLSWPPPAPAPLAGAHGGCAGGALRLALHQLALGVISLPEGDEVDAHHVGLQHGGHPHTVRRLVVLQQAAQRALRGGERAVEHVHKRLLLVLPGGLGRAQADVQPPRLQVGGGKGW